MIEHWKNQLPSEYLHCVISPTAFEHHTEPSVSADKIIGYDASGNRCFYFHSFLLTEDGFDIDEFPISIDVYYECVVAWRISEGKWVSIKSYSDQLDRCNKRLTTLPAEVTDSAPR